MKRHIELNSIVMSKLRIWKKDEEGNITIVDNFNKNGKSKVRKYKLSGSAVLIWKKCIGKYTVADIIADIVDTYKIPYEEAKNDTIDFLKQMIEAKQIIIIDK